MEKRNEKCVFIVGPHGVGKTYVVSNIKKVTDVQHIDLGPLIREAHKVLHLV